MAEKPSPTQCYRIYTSDNWSFPNHSLAIAFVQQKYRIFAVVLVTAIGCVWMYGQRMNITTTTHPCRHQQYVEKFTIQDTKSSLSDAVWSQRRRRRQRPQQQQQPNAYDIKTNDIIEQLPQCVYAYNWMMEYAYLFICLEIRLLLLHVNTLRIARIFYDYLNRTISCVATMNLQ